MPRRTQLPKYFFFSDQKRVPNWAELCLKLPRRSGVVLRDYDHPRRPEIAADMARFCQKNKLVFLIAGDPRLATQHKAGLHCPEALMPRLHRSFSKIRATNPASLITCAAHSPRAIIAAANAGLDATFLSPVFATQSGADKSPLGAVKTALWIKPARLPVLALGGMSILAHRRLQNTGHHGYAAIGSWQSTAV